MSTIKRIPSAIAAAYRAFIKAMQAAGGGGGPVEPF